MAVNDSILSSLAARMVALPFQLESDDIEDDLTTIPDDEYEHMIDALEAHIFHVEDKLNELFMAAGTSPPAKPSAPRPPELTETFSPKPKLQPAPYVPPRAQFKNEDYERILEQRGPPKPKAHAPHDGEAERLAHAEAVLRDLAGLQRQIKAARTQALRDKIARQRRHMAALEQRRIKRKEAERERTREIVARAKAKAAIPAVSNVDFLASLPKSTFYVAVADQRRGKKPGPDARPRPETNTPPRSSTVPSGADLLLDAEEDTNSWALTAAPEKDAEAAIDLLKNTPAQLARALSAPKRTALITLLGPPPSPPQAAPMARLSMLNGMQRSLLLMVGAAKRNTDVVNSLLADRLAALAPAPPDSNAVLRVLPGELVHALRSHVDLLERPVVPRKVVDTRSPRLVSTSHTPMTRDGTPLRRTPLPPIPHQAPAPAFDFYDPPEHEEEPTRPAPKAAAALTLDALQATGVCIEPTPTQSFFSLPL